jgi:hypothetical protein
MLRAGRAFVWYSGQGLRVVACMLLIAMPGQARVQIFYWLLMDTIRARCRITQLFDVGNVTGRVRGNESCVWDKEDLYTCDLSPARISKPNTSN